MKKPLQLCLAALLLSSASSQASFHLFDIQEVYSNADGSVQFIELFSSSNGQHQLSTHSIAFFIGAAQTNTFTFLTDLPVGTTNKSALIGTANLATLYGVTPDYIIPANFFAAGATNTINFGLGQDTVNISTLPNGGVQSLNGVVSDSTPGTTSINNFATPTNFAGQTAVIPEPSAVALCFVASAALMIRRKRQR